MFSPFIHLPDSNIHNNATLLMVGKQGVGKEKLARMIVDFNDPELAISMLSETLDPSALTTPRDRRIDYIIVMLDLTDQTTIELAQNQLLQLDPTYFLHRITIIATNCLDPNTVAQPIQQLERWVENLYDVPILYTDLNHKDEFELFRLRETVVKKIISRCKLANHPNAVLTNCLATYLV